MPKDTMIITRDLFDEMLQAATDKERNRIISIIKGLGAHYLTQPEMNELLEAING